MHPQTHSRDAHVPSRVSPARLPLGAGQPFLLAATLLLFAGCAPDEDTAPAVTRRSPVIPLDSGTVFIETEQDTFRVSVEIAETPNQREIGLMERSELPENQGMIFLSYEERDPAAGFYMFRTRIPLDIAFLDRDGRIVAIRSMEPCASPIAEYCPTYAPGVAYWGALEVNGGYFASRGIEPGDLVTLRRSGRILPPGDSAPGA